MAHGAGTRARGGGTGALCCAALGSDGRGVLWYSSTNHEMCTNIPTNSKILVISAQNYVFVGTKQVVPYPAGQPVI